MEDDDEGENAEIFVKSESSSKERKKEKYEPTEDELQKVRLKCLIRNCLGLLQYF